MTKLLHSLIMQCSLHVAYSKKVTIIIIAQSVLSIIRTQIKWKTMITRL